VIDYLIEHNNYSMSQCLEGAFIVSLLRNKYKKQNKYDETPRLLLLLYRLMKVFIFRRGKTIITYKGSKVKVNIHFHVLHCILPYSSNGSVRVSSRHLLPKLFAPNRELVENFLSVLFLY
jgi:hypothetical protein